MKLFTTATPVADVINPRGRLAKDMERTAKQAVWLSVVCEYWLTFKGDNVDKAKYDPPTYDLPLILPYAKRFNKARKESGAFDVTKATVPRHVRRELKSGEVKYLRGGKNVDDPESIPVAVPSEYRKWDWPWVFTHWHEGGLQRSIETLMELLPEENQDKIRKELLA